MTTRQPVPARVVRFGIFEVDVAAEEVRRNGLKVTLPRQPFQILVRLIETPGEVVTREELRRLLWADDTHVDFDHCLNTAVNKLREVLHDSADHPRYVETIPRKGYRFLAPVAEEPRAPAAQVGGADPAVSAPPESVARLAELDPRVRLARLFALAAVVLIGLAVLAWLLLWPALEPVRLPEASSITHLDGSEVTPSLSPDGRGVVFSWNGPNRASFNLYEKRLDGTAPRILTTSASNDFGPAYSPAADEVAFYRRSGDSAGVYIVGVSGGAVRRVTGLEFGPRSPRRALSGVPSELPLQSISWSPDGQYLAFVDKTAIDAPSAVFLWSLGKGQRQRLTWPPAGLLGDASPAFSPDGKMVAFARYSDPFAGEIHVISLSGGDSTRLVEDGRAVRGLTWTPDSRHIVFSSDRDGEPGLWRIDASGGTPERLASVNESAVFPSIAARSNVLAYARWSHDDAIWRVPLSSSAAGSARAERLLSQPGDNEHPRYSPDGRRIAFTLGRSGRRAIWIADADGRNPIRLTPQETYSSSPRWSPDGRHIAFDARANGNWEVFVVPSEGGDPRPLAAHRSEDSRPGWSADGKWIYFRSDRSGTTQIWKVPSQGGEPVQVTRQGGYEALESFDGRLLYYTRRGVPGIFSVPVEGGEERRVLADLPANSRNWALSPDGIYFITEEEATLREEAAVRLFRFDQTKIQPVLNLGSVSPGGSGCSISPDGRWFLFAGRDITEMDLAVIRDLPLQP